MITCDVCKTEGSPLSPAYMFYLTGSVIGIRPSNKTDVVGPTGWWLVVDLCGSCHNKFVNAIPEIIEALADKHLLQKEVNNAEHN